MSSHDTNGRYVVAYHLGGDVVGASNEYADRVASCAKLNADDKAGGRWAVHRLGPEVTDGGPS